MRGRAKFSVLLRIRFRWVFPSPFNLGICIVNCKKETEGIQWEKVALNLLVSRWSAYSNLVFVEEIKDQVYTRHCRKQTSKLSQLQNKKNLIYLQFSNFLVIFFMNRGKSSYVNQSSMRVNNLPVRSLTVFEENIVVTVLLSKVYIRFFFFTRSLNYRCQVMTNTRKMMCQSLSGNLFNHLYHYMKMKMFRWSLSLICITSILTIIYSFNNCSVYGRSCSN